MRMPALQQSICLLGFTRVAMCQPQREVTQAPAVFHGACVMTEAGKPKQIVGLLAGPRQAKSLHAEQMLPEAVHKP